MKFLVFLAGFLIMFFALNVTLGNLIFIFFFGAFSGVYFREYLKDNDVRW